MKTRAILLCPALLLVLLLRPAGLSARTLEEGERQETAVSAAEAGKAHLIVLLRQPWAAPWKGVRVEQARLVPPRNNQSFSTRLGPVMHALLAFEDGKPAGYLMWEPGGSGVLTEFALEGRMPLDGPDGKLLPGIPPLQQFPVPGGRQGRIASGCVPTAGASVLGYWIGQGHRNWLGPDSSRPGPEKGGEENRKETGKEAGKPEPATAREPAPAQALPALAQRLRARLTMTEFPDQDGFTPDGLSLAGARPGELATAIRQDAAEHGVPLTAELHPFRFDLLREEISRNRPVLLSCTVRLPLKPELSWGHEVAGAGWLQLDGAEFAGVLDNWFPSAHPETIRWIRAGAFHTLVTVRPADPVPKPGTGAPPAGR